MKIWIERKVAARARHAGASLAWSVMVALALASATSHAQSATAPTLQAAVDAPLRSTANRERDAYRHPRATLEFFGLTPAMRVVEVWPGNGWYTEILAPYLRTSGALYEAEDFGPDATDDPAALKRAHRFEQKLAQDPDAYDKVTVMSLVPPAYTNIRPPGGADMVLTFRNIHDWMKTATVEPMFAAFYTALKPGGILGIEEHRAPPGTSLQKMIDTGYVTENYVIQQARAAGFKLVARSEINANPKDDRDHPHGVWSLPPTFADGDATRATYSAIGESDRMTLKFIKAR